MFDDCFNSFSCHHGKCDCCNGPVFGAGLRLIRAVAMEKFKVKNLPFIFTLCSPTCRRTLKRKPNSHWMKVSVENDT